MSGPSETGSSGSGTERKSGGCAGCGSSLGESAVLGVGALWHGECFKCAECGTVLKEAYAEGEGRALCLGCHASAFNPRCEGCRQPLTYNNAVKAMEAHWHPGCFKCAACAAPLNDAFYVVNGRPYDIDCHWTVRLANFLAKPN